MKKEIYEKIIQKKEFSQLPKRDVEMAFGYFDKKEFGDEEKIKLTRNLLRKIFSAFTSQKILKLKDKSAKWVLRKHLSTKERLDFYEEVYRRTLKGEKKKLSIIDLGAGVNGFSYEYFSKLGYDVNYLGVEAMGQLVDLMNDYFFKEKFNAHALHLSLFELEKIKDVINLTLKPRIVFLFKTIDSLEMMERNYSKDFLNTITPLVGRVVVSFATKSLIKRSRFKVKRNWIVNFIEENFNVLDDFEIGAERYLIFSGKIN